jgi:hypothetical protein
MTCINVKRGHIIPIIDSTFLLPELRLRRSNRLLGATVRWHSFDRVLAKESPRGVCIGI